MMTRVITIFRNIAPLAVGAILGGGAVLAATESPKEHLGLNVETLGVIPASSVETTTGLEGYRLQLRSITIAPGGQIAEHSHANRPGLVKVISGEWIEGSPDGEKNYSASGPKGILEDENTTHWFYNRGDEPATAIVCDLTPES